MKNNSLLYYIEYYLIILLPPAIAFVTVLIRYKKIQGAAKFLALLVASAFITECVACYTAVKYRNNNHVYALFDVLELVMCSLYFNYSIPLFRKYKAGIIIALAGLIMGAVNAWYIEPESGMKLNFTMFSSIVTITMCFYSLYHIVVRNWKYKFRYNPNFWLVSIIMVYKFSDFIFWGVYYIFYDSPNMKHGSIYLIIHEIRLVCYYLAFSAIFLYFPRKQKNHE